MLKIKDNIDLKELEKFGFEIANAPNKDVKYVKYYSGKNCMYFYKDKSMYFEIQEYDYDDYLVDDLYDLIKADMVEKV